MTLKEVIKKIKNSYKENKQDLESITEFIDENGCDDSGCSDATATFEQGYNNALEFVLELLKEVDTNSDSKNR